MNRPGKAESRWDGPRRVLDRARRTLGRRQVNWTPDFMGFGNQLYLWAWAHQHRAAAQEPKVLITDKARYWLAQVPTFAERFLIERHDVRFLDNRGHYWAEPLRYTGDKRGFTEASRAEFIQALRSEPLLTGVGSGPTASDDCLTINVRRGDFYSDHFRSEHGMDVVGYLRLAVEGAVADAGAPARIHVVSDDLAWCHEHLDWLTDHAPSVTTPDAGTPPAEQWRQICSARRLIVTNSTFSLWGAFVSNVVHGDNRGLIWAPAFFQKRYGGGRCFEYDADWRFVDELPGGWQPDWMLQGDDRP